MEVTLNVNINAPSVDKLVDLLMTELKNVKNAAANPVETVKDDKPPFLRNQAPSGAATPAAKEETASDEKPARKTRSKTDAAAPPPVENTAPKETAPADNGITTAMCKEKLTNYAADKRFGMDGVFKILAKYGVDRVTALAEKDFAAFCKEIDEALAKPDPLA